MPEDVGLWRPAGNGGGVTLLLPLLLVPPLTDVMLFWPPVLPLFPVATLV